MRNTAVTESKGSSGSYSEAGQILGRYLIDPAELGRLERDERFVLITGLPPFRSKKYDVAKRPRWGEREVAHVTSAPLAPFEGSNLSA